MRRLQIVVLLLAVVAVSCSESEPTPTVAVPDAPVRTPVTVPPTVEPTITTTSAPAVTTAAPDGTTTTAAPTTTSTIPIGELELELDLVASGFSQPVLVTAPPGDSRLFVVDQPGRVWVVADGDPEVFLDIRDDVAFRGERGLLGLAFAPDYAESGVFYVNYTNNGGSTVVASFVTVGDAVDVASRTIHLTVAQPAGNHNGGNLTFGPDGYLWIGMGDGGGANDRFRHGQRASSQLGAMLRIEPTADGFAVPARSAAITTDAADGVWAIGVRNPWRFAFDGDLLFVADVGQNRIEEISVVDVRSVNEDPRECVGCVPLPNFGWPIQEGSECFSRSDCDAAGLIQPAAEYTHADGCSITGGFVYRGSAIAPLRGQYLYGDYCSGWIRSFGYDTTTGTASAPIEWFETGTVDRLTSFGQDGFGELYVMSADGEVYALVEGG